MTFQDTLRQFAVDGPAALGAGADALDMVPSLEAALTTEQGRADALQAQVDAFLAQAATSKPSSDNTSLRPDAPPLTRHTGSIVVKDSGSVIEDMEIYDGDLSVAAPNCTIRNVSVRGRLNPATTNPGTARGLIHCTNAANRGLKIEDCLLRPDVPHWSLVGVLGHDWESKRLRVMDVGDGFGIYGLPSDKPVDVNVFDEGSWISALSFFRPSGNGTVPEGTHNDDCQIQGGYNWGFTRTRLDGFCDPTVGNLVDSQYAPLQVSTSCVMITPNVSPVGNGFFHGVYMDGGSTSLNVSEKGFGAVKGLDLDIQFGRGQRTGKQAFMASATKTITDLSRLRFEDGKGVPQVQAG